MPGGIGADLRLVRGQVAELDHAEGAGQTQHVEKHWAKRRQVNLAKIADGAKIRRYVPHDGQKRQIAFAGGRDLAARAVAEAVDEDQKGLHHIEIKRRLAPRLLGVMTMVRAKAQRPNYVEQKEDQIAFGQLLAWRNGLLSTLLSVPGSLATNGVGEMKLWDLAPGK